MKTWMLGAVIGALAGASLYLTLTHRSSPPPAVPVERAAPQAVTTAPPKPPAPLVLPQVVDVTDIDPLLDPPAIPAAEPAAPAGPTITRVGYEDTAPMPAAPAADVKPIPPAATDNEGAGRVAPAELALLIGLLVSDSPEPQVAPPPRAVIPEWERGFQPVPGPVMLDEDAARARYPERPVEPARFDGTFSPFRRHRVYMSADEGFKAWTAATPLGPLFALSDADLLKPPPAVLELPGSTGGRWVWVPDPAIPNAALAAVRRAYAVFHAANQAPASRIEWYDRWYGDGQFPKQLGSILTAEQLRDYWDQHRVPVIGYPFGSSNTGIGLFF